MKQVEYRTGEADSGRRVDVVMSEHFSEFSRAAWQESLKNYPALVDDQAVSSSYKLKASQTVKAVLPIEKSTEARLIKPKQLPEILYKDNNVIVINKPAGLITHPTPALASEPSVAGAFADLIKDDDDPIRPGIVHRLDRDTSGVMIIARDLSTKEFLQEQFRNRKVKKVYTALVRGRLKQPAARIELPLQKSKRQPNTMVVHAGGRLAITEYNVIAEYPDASLLAIDIYTGRTHQIRAHFAHLGHPIVGDTVYGKDSRPEGLARQFLHAASLTISLPSDKEQTFTAELPLDLTSYLERL